MLDSALLRSHLADTARRLATRGYALDTAALEAIEVQRKHAQIETQELQNLRNTRSRAIGVAKGRVRMHPRCSPRSLVSATS